MRGLRLISRSYLELRQGEGSIEVAARERDEQLLLAGRDTVGIDDQLKKRQEDRSQAPKDHLDHLIDQLDALDL